MIEDVKRVLNECIGTEMAQMEHYQEYRRARCETMRKKRELVHLLIQEGFEDCLTVNMRRLTATMRRRGL